MDTRQHTTAPPAARRWAAGAAAFLAASGGLTSVFPAAARQEPTPRPVPPPRILPPPRPWPAQVRVTSVAVNAVVRGGVAETEVTHVFKNDAGVPQEGDFVFPIAAGASVSSFAMYDGETKLDARLLDKDEATSTYEEIVRRRRDPALLTYQGRAALRARVFPIAPGGERKVTLKLVTVLPREGDAKKYAWTLVGPYLPGGAKPEKVSVRVEVVAGQGGAAVGNVYSPTHEVEVKRPAAGRVVATWESGAKDAAALAENPEFDLYVGAPAGAQQNVALSVLTYNASLPQVASIGGGVRQSGYFLVVASPAIVSTEKSALPRRVVLVMDRSGSMAGKKIEQARGALKFALARLRPQDSFNLLTFSDRVEKFSPEPVAASADNVKRANAFVDDIVADGGTNINDALKQGLEQFPEKGSGNTLLFFTDGLPTVGQRDQGAIVKNAVAENAKKARAFVFGVGYDVDVPFLDNVAQGLRGDADYVRPDEDIEVKTSRFVAKTSAPVLENLRLKVDGGGAGEIYPRPDDLPDLFAGSQLVLVGRYVGQAHSVRIALTGDAGGRPQTYSLNADFPAVDTQSAFLSRLWASRKIGHLMDEVRLKEAGPARQEVIDQIVALSKEYGVLTPYTAMFVPEPADGSRPAGPGVVLGRPSGGGGFGGGRLSDLSAAAPAPRQGEAAVNASQGARGQRTQNQVGNVYAYRAKAGAEKDRDERLARRIQNVANRTFYQNGAVWQDATYEAARQKEVVKVKLYSPAYFALTRRNADLAKWAALGENVLIAVNGTQAVQFGPEGKESLTDAEVAKLAGK
jgi:Ca-activated chloride channel family protein